MYESETYETVLKRLLDNVPSTLDKREGSVIYTALAPAAYEIAKIYSSLDIVLSETFADTASRYYLVKRAAERKITPKQATNAVLKGEFDKKITVGARFSGGSLNYRVSEVIDEDGDLFYYKLTCETEGSVGNTYTGKLIPINDIDGLKTAALTEILIHGTDVEETEAFRERYFQSIYNQSFGGNVADYKNYMSQLQDVGGSRIYPVWNGAGTVKIVFVNSEYGVPSETLIDYVQEEIDPPEYSGMGIGMAPIDHKVTVVGAEEEVINISFKCQFLKNYEWDDVSESVKSVIESYFSELNSEWSNWEDEQLLVVRITQIENRVLNIYGIEDVFDTKINGEFKNYTAGENAVIKLGAITNDTA